MSERIEVDGAKPADSGRVTDEVVTRACNAYFDALPPSGGVAADREAMRLAITAALAAQGQGEVAEDNVQCSHCGAIFTRRDWTADNFDRPIPRCQCCGSSGAPQPVRTTETAPPASPAGVPDGWLPIESAPNDGTPHVRGLHVFSSTDGAHLYWDAVVGRVDTEDGQFYDLGGDLSSGWAADDFTHWHALAAAPSAPESNT